MADTKISALTAATTPLAGTEVLPIVQSGTTKQVSVANLTAGRAVSGLTFTSTVATGTAPFTVTSTTQVANLNAATAGTASNLKSNATTGVLQVSNISAAATRVMTVPDADFSVARIDAAQTFTGVNTFVTAGTGTGAPIYVSPTSNAVADVFTGRNLSTGTSAITRFALGNNLTPTGFTITQYGGNHATNANKVQINNEFTSSISISANGGTDNIILASNGNLTLETGNLVFGTSAKGINTSAANPFTFNINGSERGRVTAGGYTKFTSDGSYYNSTGTYHEFYQSADAWGAIVTAANSSQTNTGFRVFCARNTTNNTYYAIDYYNTIGDNVRFRVADSGNVTNVNGSYGTISDLKMKTDIVDAGSQWDDIKAIRFRKFKMRDDPDQIVQLGVVAQELEQTSPGLIEEHIDRDEENNDLGTTTKSVKTSVLLMKAAKALQEAMARIEVLETQVAELKTK